MNFSRQTRTLCLPLILCFTFAACSSAPKNEPPPMPTAPAKAIPLESNKDEAKPKVSSDTVEKTDLTEKSPNTATSTAPAEAGKTSATATEAETKGATQSEATEAPAQKSEAAISQKSESHHEAHKREVGAVPWDKSLGWLKNGNIRFRKGFLRKDGQGAANREALTKGQHPHAIVLSCSDSRVPPEIVFDQKLGEIFVVRTAGESLDAAALASIEYAVAHLGSNLLVVMGHESCGAVKAAFATLDGADAGSTWLNKLVADIHPRIASFKGKELSKGGIQEGWANVQGVAHDLIERSDIVREAVESGSLKIAKGLYHLDSGEVKWQE